MTEHRHDVSDEVARLVARCLEKDPGGRYHDARELLVAINALLDENNTSFEAHPHAPSVDGIQRWVFEWELKSTPRALWSYVSNTDRVNRAIGLGSVDERVDLEDGDPVRVGHSRQAGFDLRWREHP